MLNNDIARAYDAWAPQYDRDLNLTRDLDAHILRTNGPDCDGADVLELGCGTGKNTSWLIGQARSVVAMDFSSEMLNIARMRVQSEGVRYVQHDIQTRWPLADTSIDLIVANLVLEHIECLQPVVAEAARVIRPGGQFFVCELHPYRQLRGGQAHFIDGDTGEVVHVPAFVHSVSEYVNTGIENGFRLLRFGEWVDAGVDSRSVPRLLSALFER